MLKPQRILYILAQYPNRSETFIAREIRALSCRTEIIIYALRGRRGALADLPIFYRHEWTWQRVAGASLGRIFRRPGATLRALSAMLIYWRQPVYALKVLRNLLYAMPMLDWVEGNGVDRIHAHFADMPTDVAIFIGKLSDCRVSFSTHARDVFSRPAGLVMKCRFADVVFACNQQAASLLAQLSGALTIHVIHHGLDFNEPLWDAVYERRRRIAQSGHGDGRPVRLLAVGRFVEKKGFQVLIEALHFLKQRHVAFECRIIGGGSQRQRLAAQVDEHEMNQQVALEDFKPHAALADDLSECDLLVQPSLIADDGDQDGIPNIIIEAFACGVPVVATDLPQLREVIEHGRTGWLAASADPCSLADTIVAAIAGSGTLRQMAEEGRRQARMRFDVSRNVTEMQDCWQAAESLAGMLL
ncbi:MAG: glycosyltransferase family 4 protein [Blastocatellia bacterium]